MSIPLSRRTAIGALAAAPLTAFAAGRQPEPGEEAPPTLTGNLRHSVCRWCYGNMPLEDLCRHAANIGIESVELLYEAEWAVPPRFGLTCAVAMGPTQIHDGLNRVENHDRIVAESERMLPLVREAGIPMMIVFSGNRNGLDDAEGLKNCAAGLKRIAPLAEKAGVTLVMELLNSKVDHRDYQCDRTPWGVRLVDEVGSPRFRLLYDIYHMQVMEGDVIRTITDYSDRIAHYHTGGVPGRREIDDTQELNYPAICRAIVETGYKGFLGQEFIPARDPMASLKEAVLRCDV